MNPKVLLTIDNLFYLPYLVISFISRLVRRISTKKHKGNKTLYLKFMGLGSITRFWYQVEKNQIDKNNIILATFSQNKHLCDLLGIETIIIRNDSLIHFIIDLFHSIYHINYLVKPSKIVDLERCSYAVSIYRLFISLKSETISLIKANSFKKDMDKYISIGNKNASDILIETFEDLKKDLEYYHQDERVKIQKNKILINVNASEYLSERRFPANQFISLIKKLNSVNPDWEFYFTGSEAEQAYVEKIVNQLKQENIKVFNKAKEWNLRQFIDELKDCHFFITNDSGPLHIAKYMGIHIISIWGPTSSQLVGYKDSDIIRNIYSQMSCAPCFKHPKSKIAEACNKNIDCFNELSPTTISRIINNFAETIDTYRTFKTPYGILNETKNINQVTYEN